MSMFKNNDRILSEKAWARNFVEIVVNTVQYSTVQYNTIQYNTIQYNTIQYSTIQYNTVQYSTIQYNTVQYSARVQSPVTWSSGQLCRYMSSLRRQFGGVEKEKEKDKLCVCWLGPLRRGPKQKLLLSPPFVNFMIHAIIGTERKT